MSTPWGRGRRAEAWAIAPAAETLNFADELSPRLTAAANLLLDTRRVSVIYASYAYEQNHPICCIREHAQGRTEGAQSDAGRTCHPPEGWPAGREQLGARDLTSRNRSARVASR